jgi:hypothetical protein
MGKLSLIISCLSLFCLPAHAAPRYIQVDNIKPPGYLQRNTSTTRIFSGLKLIEGDNIFVPSRSDARFTLDINQGYFLVQSPAQFKIETLQNRGCGAVTWITLYTGRIYNGLRNFTCKDSIYGITDLPRGRVIRHLGTDFSVSITGDRMISGVASGVILASSKNVEERVPAGFAALMVQGQAPFVEPIDYEMRLNDVKIQAWGINQLKISGKTSALNQVWINGDRIDQGNLTLQKTWHWIAFMPKPKNGFVEVTVENALGTQRVFLYRKSVN